MANEINNTAAISPIGNFQYNPYIYDDLDMDFSTYPMAGFGGSIFGGGFAMPPMGFAGGNNGNYFDNMRDYQRFYIDYNIDQQKMQRNADLKINASVEGIKEAAELLKDKVVNNEQDQIPGAFHRYVESVRAAYGSGTEHEITSRALTLYTSMNGGKSLFEDLREYGHGSATQGFTNALTFGLYNRLSAEDNISAISGAPVGTGEKAKHNLGRVAGAATVGLGAAGITKLFTKGTKQAAQTSAKGIAKYLKFGKKAGVVGLLVGLTAGLLSFMTGKVTT